MAEAKSPGRKAFDQFAGNDSEQILEMLKGLHPRVPDIITENIFNYPGMGMYFIKASTNGDFPQLMPYLVIVVTSVLLFNLVADVTYAFLDPRIRLD